MKKRWLSVLAATAGTIFITSTAQADGHGDMARAQMLSYACAGCHGTDGASAGPSSPTIGGMGEDTFIDSMLAFKEDERPSTVMGRLAKGYSDEDIELMATFFAEQKWVSAQNQSFDAANVETGSELHEEYCSKCHEEGGTVDVDGSGILAGQWRPYLEHSMADYLGGSREASKKMAKNLKKLQDAAGDDGFKAVIDFYVSQQ